MLQPTCSLALVQHVDEALLSCCWPRWACGFCNAACGVQLRLLADRLEWTLSEAKQDLVKLQSQVRQPPHSQARRRSAPPRTSGPHSAAQLGRKTCLHMGWVSTEQLKCQVCQTLTFDPRLHISVCLTGWQAHLVPQSHTGDAL